ncbi:xanthine dehydrogenase subunit XdhC [Propioniciclava tarda]|uniref:(2Fe-2S)-binding protein n=1 Tax=Propioniciclava tarda TaxID=433330 RepID=A0A4Q9KNL5_PROTD|nr:xanthine dehydrogenase subunit XdhC [Propioniciclava tarda]TBT95399.1 (2Fe-2S)-binding protein [Propioniciclava tarda]SMO78723.1 carbon-monoxide dehydrogenase small subunit [Propioniciclava tarda]HOA88470.1 (2Fe-2S)-binding protein [Propioniciclava tarda]HQA30756.1 (2Fe-2S)-binding protein [Propioniciclava tarda]HQD60123.1 (2Fe-2S)-binding protein [Propioniciclava tarda]
MTKTAEAFRNISFTINGRPTTRSVDVRSSLSDLLRDELGLTSVKKGCEVGECGACSVLIDGIAIDSCIYLAVWVDGKDLVTTEGLADADGTLSIAQQAFVDATAVQCGFCTPGLLLTTTELLDSGQTYTRDELRTELAGHLCRCTGYQNILNAVELAQERHQTQAHIGSSEFWDAVTR